MLSGMATPCAFAPQRVGAKRVCPEVSTEVPSSSLSAAIPAFDGSSLSARRSRVYTYKASTISGDASLCHAHNPAADVSLQYTRKTAPPPSVRVGHEIHQAPRRSVAATIVWVGDGHKRKDNVTPRPQQCYSVPRENINNIAPPNKTNQKRFRSKDTDHSLPRSMEATAVHLRDPTLEAGSRTWKITRLQTRTHLGGSDRTLNDTVAYETIQETRKHTLIHHIHMHTHTNTNTICAKNLAPRGGSRVPETHTLADDIFEAVRCGGRRGEDHGDRQRRPPQRARGNLTSTTTTTTTTTSSASASAQTTSSAGRQRRRRGPAGCVASARARTVPPPSARARRRRRRRLRRRRRNISLAAAGGGAVPHTALLVVPSVASFRAPPSAVRGLLFLPIDLGLVTGSFGGGRSSGSSGGGRGRGVIVIRCTRSAPEAKKSQTPHRSPPPLHLGLSRHPTLAVFVLGFRAVVTATIKGLDAAGGQVS